MATELTQKQIEKLLKEFNEINRKQKDLNERLTEIKDTLKTFADETGMENGSYFMGDTLKSRYDNLWRDKFNSKQLKKDNINLYNKYVQVGYTHQVTINNPEII